MRLTNVYEYQLREARRSQWSWELMLIILLIVSKSTKCIQEKIDYWIVEISQQTPITVESV